MRGKLVAMLLAGASGLASAQDSAWQLEGYGTLAAHAGDDSVAGVRADGRNRRYSVDKDVRWDGDSLLALQARYEFGRGWQAVWQVLTLDDIHYGQRPRTEWLYLGYDASPNTRIKLGRMALPVFLHSETRHLGYAQTTVRPVNVIYQLNPFTNVDGLSLQHGWRLGEGDYKGELSLGRSQLSVPNGVVDATRIASLALRRDEGPWSLRWGLSGYKFDTKLSSIERLIATLSSGSTGCINCAPILAERVPTRDIKGYIHTVALNHERGPWNFGFEIAQRKTGSTTAADAWAWYFLLSRRIGAFTPYWVVGEQHFTEPPLDFQTHPAAPPQAAAANAMIARYLQSQIGRNIWQVGVRWDIRDRVSLKLQLESYHNTREIGLGQSNVLEVPAPPPLGNYRGPSWDGKVRQLSLNLDFVF